MPLSRRTLLALLSAAVALPARAGEPSVFAKAGFAISGYDPVAYFTTGGPVPGKTAFPTEWNGATWLFSNEKNLEAFVDNPTKFAPRYGGYCAYAVSRGYTAPTRPDAWTIHDGKLYLNLNKTVRDLWLQDIPGHIASANGNWPRVLK